MCVRPCPWYKILRSNKVNKRHGIPKDKRVRSYMQRWIGDYIFCLIMKNSGTSSLFFIISDGSCVNSLGSGNKDGSDLSIGLEVSESSTGKSSIDLELFYN
mmetsp:Transcript_28612/g.59937  ORF Transcript_28612/g.59937 Transcript_28612/m.59937 type:complete len:101 (+) Transcript_28612:243-545(+)